MDRTAGLLSELIACETVNPPGDTRAVATLLRDRLAPLGAEIDMIDAPRDGGPTHFIARLRGDGSKRPLLLAAHSDVVPVDRTTWNVEPFGKTIADGYVLGRGAMDFKGGLAVFATAVMMLAENRTPLARDVILLSEGDEETAGPHGTRWLAEHHWDRIDCEFALNEGGWILQDQTGTARHVNITVRDKTAILLHLTAHGAPTHSAWPGMASQTAIGRLTTALARLVATDTEPRMTDLTRIAFRALGRSVGGEHAADFATLADGNDATARTEAGHRIATRSAYPALFHALMRDTVSLTMLNAGIKENVIPGTARASLNCRLLPGTTLDDIVAHVRTAIADPGIEIAVAAHPSLDTARDAIAGRTLAPASSTDTDLFRALVSEARITWPHAEIVPALFEAGTDAIAWRMRGVPVYGIYPYPIDNETLIRMHGNDERIGVAALTEGTGWVHRVLLAVAGKT